MQTRHIRAFLAIAESGSIRAGARSLGISQPALTRTIRELEASLAAPLFVRSAQGTEFTKYGNAFLARAMASNEQLRLAKEEIGQLLGEKGGNVAIGLATLPSLLMGAQALNEFWKDHPDAKVRLVDGRFRFLVNSIHQGSIEFAICHVPQKIPDGLRINVEPLFKQSLIPVVRRGHPALRHKSLADLRDARWLLTTSDPVVWDYVGAAFSRHKLAPPRAVVVCESFPAMLPLLEQSDLVAALPAGILSQSDLAQRLAAVPIAEKLYCTTVALIHAEGIPLTPLASQLMQIFRRIGRRIKATGKTTSGR